MKPVNPNDVRESAYEPLEMSNNDGWEQVSTVVRKPVLAPTFNLPTQFIEFGGIVV